jgi:hypothetical protein
MRIGFSQADRGAEAFADFLVDFIAGGGYNGHRDILESWRGFELLQGLAAVQLGHVEIQHNKGR